MNYYLETVCTDEQLALEVGIEDFGRAIMNLKPSISVEELERYESLRAIMAE